MVLARAQAATEGGWGAALGDGTWTFVAHKVHQQSSGHGARNRLQPHSPTAQRHREEESSTQSPPKPAGLRSCRRQLRDPHSRQPAPPKQTDRRTEPQSRRCMSSTRQQRGHEATTYTPGHHLTGPVATVQATRTRRVNLELGPGNPGWPPWVPDPLDLQVLSSLLPVPFPAELERADRDRRARHRTRTRLGPLPVRNGL